jgi:hypothetical protein
LPLSFFPVLPIIFLLSDLGLAMGVSGPYCYFIRYLESLAIPFALIIQ